MESREGGGGREAFLWGEREYGDRNKGFGFGAKEM